MRFLCFVFLVAFAAAVAFFALQNQQTVTLNFFDRTVTSNIAAVVGGAYVLGMLSGWTVVGMLRRSLHETSELAGGRHAHAR